MDKEEVVAIAKKESVFQQELKQEIENMFPGAIVAKMEAFQGVPDLIVLWYENWALLECKRSKNASKQPNQDYYVNMFRTWSYSAFIYPENKQEVLDELQSAFRSKKPARVPKR